MSSVFDDDDDDVQDIVQLDGSSSGAVISNMGMVAGQEEHQSKSDCCRERAEEDSSQGSLSSSSSSSSSSCGIDCGGVFSSERNVQEERRRRPQAQRSLSFAASPDHIRRKVELLMDQCESTTPQGGKRKLNLENLQLTRGTFPVQSLCGTPTFCRTLWCLRLAGNNLGSVPEELVVKLTALRALDLSMCNLTTLPKKWNLPCLKKLRLSHNRLSRFPSEGVLEGIPELQCLDLSGNEIGQLSLPRGAGQTLLLRLQYLDVGANQIASLPLELARLTSLTTLKVRGNRINTIPDYICHLDTLQVLDVGCNPLCHPPVETCERGICSIKRYFRCLHREDGGEGEQESSRLPQGSPQKEAMNLCQPLHQPTSLSRILSRWKS